MSKIAHLSTCGTIKTSKEIQAKLWPNGEVSIWRPRTFKPEPMVRPKDESATAYRMSIFRLQLEAGLWVNGLASALGLSPLPIFDTVSNRFTNSSFEPLPDRSRKGLTGITSYGKRMVRNAVTVIEESHGKARCVFATATVPNFPVKQMAMIHENWHQLVEYYRLGVRRKLQNKGLSGEIVTVSEVQEHRHQVTGLPILHLHSVFGGVDRTGKYAITTEEHDDIWFRALKSVVNIERDDCAASCNLQRVKKSAAAYLGKYMSKGSSAVSAVVGDGFSDWLPKHWWNCSRSLSTKVKRDTRVVNSFADWLNDMADVRGNGVWCWHRDVLIEMADGQQIPMARYGRLKPFVAAQIEMSLDPW